VSPVSDGAPTARGVTDRGVGNIILLALAAAVYPILLAGVIVILARDKPARQLAAFLAGDMLISITAGLIIVFALDGTVSTSNQ
jgi:hypothetical protein